jgi:hypothetical protein
VTGWLQSAGGDPTSTGRCVHVTKLSVGVGYGPPGPLAKE